MRIDILLNEEGTLKASFFNRENSIRNFGEEIGYTQGAGLTYNVDFDNFKELFDILFKGKNNEKNQKKSGETEKVIQEDLTPYFINIKSKKSTKNN